MAADRMDQLLETLKSQGFKAVQTQSGDWTISRDRDGSWICLAAPATPRDLINFLNALKRFGLVFPPEDDQDDD
jgi:hypothetical protein